MEAPKCKLCGQRHYGLCRAREGVTPHNQATAVHPERAVQDNAKPPVNAGGKPKFDRTAYQREYMRKRRAAKKDKPK